MAPNDAQSLDGILQHITSATNLSSLNHTLRNTLPKEAREVILASHLSSGQDPLSVLDLRHNTLGVLYIMSARLNHPSAPLPPWDTVVQFTREFVPEQARAAPDRVTLLARGIQRQAALAKNPKLAIEPLLNIVQRYPYDPSFLTNIHHFFVLQCLLSHSYTSVLPLLHTPITNVSIVLSPELTYNDNLIYHYLMGIALAALKQWADAEEYFEICVTSPGSVPAALQLEALKKLTLVQLISKGHVSPLPKYTHPNLGRMLKASPYNAFVAAYPQKVATLKTILDKEKQLFNTEKNIGLLNQAINRAPRWVLKKLTATYVTLGLKEIGKAIKIEDEDEVRALLLSMIESNDIYAQISADGTVTFSDPPLHFTKEQIDAALKNAQEQAELLRHLDLEMGRSKEFLTKVTRNRNGDEWGPGASIDDEMAMYSTLGSMSGAWAEEFS